MHLCTHLISSAGNSYYSTGQQNIVYDSQIGNLYGNTLAVSIFV